MMKQLENVFQKLDQKITLEYDHSIHQKQSELVTLLEQLASVSKLIETVKGSAQSDVPSFKIVVNGSPVGVGFKGIPGGHEFSSLILAILNSNKKGKLPDDVIIERIKKIKGPINLKTFVSLTCENCPDVVQALNLMAIYHPQISHEMVDGAYFQKDIQKLNIQGVPSVMDGETLIHSGKIDLVGLLEKCEKYYGTDESQNTSILKDLGEFDVAVIGAGPAGSSAAIYSARKGLRTIVLAQKVGGQVKDTKGIENLISVPYTEGPELVERLSKHMNQYDIPVMEHRRVVEVVDQGEFKKIKFDTNEFLKTKSLIIATGAKWRELGIPGEKEYIGRGVAFCPHCDGPYYKGKDVAVIGGGNSGVEAAIDLSGIVRSVTLFEFLPELKADQVLVNKLKSIPNVTIIKNAQTTQIMADGQKVIGLEYKDRSNQEVKVKDLEGVFVQIGLLPNSGFIKDLVETNRFGEIVIDSKCRTNVKGIYAAGDVTTVPYKQIIISMGEGAKAALAAFEDQMQS